MSGGIISPPKSAVPPTSVHERIRYAGKLSNREDSAKTNGRPTSVVIGMELLSAAKAVFCFTCSADFLANLPRIPRESASIRNRYTSSRILVDNSQNHNQTDQA